MTYKKIFETCLKIAKKELPFHPEYRNFMHWSFIIVDKQIVGWETNKQENGKNNLVYGYKIDYRESVKYKSHAELNVIIKYISDVYKKGFDIINIRLNKKGELRNSKPCNVCYSLIKKHGVRKVFFTTEYGFCQLI